MSITPSPYPVGVVVGTSGMHAILRLPEGAKGLIIFAHGSGSGRLSPRNTHVAQALQVAGFATLLLDLLTTEEENDRANVFDIDLLAARLAEASRWAKDSAGTAGLPIGFFGASTGGGAALAAAARIGDDIKAVVSRGGRPDLAGPALPMVRCPTLLLVGSRDTQVLQLNQAALAKLRCEKRLAVIPGATHLFEEPGTLDQVVALAIDWFERHLAAPLHGRPTLPFADRRAAGRQLADALAEYRQSRPLVLALPRGGVPVGYEVATALDGDLDLLLVRKLGAPGQPELAIGAIIDGDHPQIVLNEHVVAQVDLAPGYIHNEAHRQLIELERRRVQYLGDAQPLPVEGRTVIVVDDGIATGATMAAALRGIRKKNPGKLVLAVPVAPFDSLRTLSPECDKIVCLASPSPFFAVGAHYVDFDQTSDEEVGKLLAAARKVEPAAMI